MKKFLTFFLGFITGVFMLCAIGLCSGGNDNGDLTLFDEPGDVMPFKSIKVFDVVNVDEGDSALARAYENTDLTSLATGMTVLVINSDGQPYYDEQVIKASSTACFRQIGLYNYNYGPGDKTVPVVSLVNR